MWGTTQSVDGPNGGEITGKVVSVDIDGRPTRIIDNDGKEYERGSWTNHTFYEK